MNLGKTFKSFQEVLKVTAGNSLSFFDEELLDSNEGFFGDFSGDFPEYAFVNVKLDVFFPFENLVNRMKNEDHDFGGGPFLQNAIIFLFGKVGSQ